MKTYSHRSEEALATCHPDLQRLFRAVLYDGVDHTIICGHREKAAQDMAVKMGKSKATWPNSRHNSLPSNAVDVAPFLTIGTGGGIPWDDEWAWHAFADVVKRKATELSIDIKWGGDFKTFFDGPHWELRT